MITRESVAEKLGFDPMNPPPYKGDGWSIDDNTPSIWAPLTEEEREFVFEMLTGMKFPQ